MLLLVASLLRRVVAVPDELEVLGLVAALLLDELLLADCLLLLLTLELLLVPLDVPSLEF